VTFSADAACPTTGYVDRRSIAFVTCIATDYVRHLEPTSEKNMRRPTSPAPRNGGWTVATRTRHGRPRRAWRTYALTNLGPVPRVSLPPCTTASEGTAHGVLHTRKRSLPVGKRPHIEIENYSAFTNRQQSAAASCHACHRGRRCCGLGCRFRGPTHCVRLAVSSTSPRRRWISGSPLRRDRGSHRSVFSRRARSTGASSMSMRLDDSARQRVRLLRRGTTRRDLPEGAASRLRCGTSAGHSIVRLSRYASRVTLWGEPPRSARSLVAICSSRSDRTHNRGGTQPHSKSSDSNRRDFVRLVLYVALLGRTDASAPVDRCSYASAGRPRTPGLASRRSRTRRRRIMRQGAPYGYRGARRPRPVGISRAVHRCPSRRSLLLAFFPPETCPRFDQALFRAIGEGSMAFH